MSIEQITPRVKHTENKNDIRTGFLICMNYVAGDWALHFRRSTILYNSREIQVLQILEKEKLFENNHDSNHVFQ